TAATDFRVADSDTAAAQSGRSAPESALQADPDERKHRNPRTARLLVAQTRRRERSVLKGGAYASLSVARSCHVEIRGASRGNCDWSRRWQPQATFNRARRRQGQTSQRRICRSGAVAPRGAATSGLYRYSRLASDRAC